MLLVAAGFMPAGSCKKRNRKVAPTLVLGGCDALVFIYFFL